VRVDQCVSAFRVVEGPVFACIRTSSKCNDLNEVGGLLRFMRLALLVFIQDDGDFMDATLLIKYKY
jgi:hypothetical protein